MIKVKQFEFGSFGVNTYILVDDATQEAAVVDPAMQTESEKARFDDYISSNGIRVTQIINTHLHLDHCFGMDYVKTKYQVGLKANPQDEPLAKMMDMQYQMFGMRPTGQKVQIDVPLADGDIIEIGQSSIVVIATPGHTQGGVCLYDREDKLLFTGDTLFAGGVGRTDLPGGNAGSLYSSIKNKIFSLPADVLVLPGHGPYSTVGEEKSHNPYIN